MSLIKKNGFTLIELVVVVSVMALVMGIGIPQLKRVFRTNLKTASLQLAGYIKHAYDSAVVKHKIHRIVFDFEQKNYFLEISQSDKLVDISGQDQEEGFVGIATSMNKIEQLPTGIIFDSLENLTTKIKITEGKAYLYFFPHGETESLIIRLSGGTSNTGFYSIKINPINGKCEVNGRYVEI